MMGLQVRSEGEAEQHGCPGLDSGKQSQEALEHKVVQQQADISRLESQLAALQSHFGPMSRWVCACVWGGECVCV